MQELDVVVLTRNLDEHGLRSGDVGTVVHRYGDGAAYEVEFVTAAGATVAVVTLKGTDFSRFCSAFDEVDAAALESFH